MFHDEAKFLHMVERGGLNLMIIEAYGATNCTIMEVGGATSSMLKVCGASYQK